MEILKMQGRCTSRTALRGMLCTSAVREVTSPSDTGGLASRRQPQ